MTLKRTKDFRIVKEDWKKRTGIPVTLGPEEAKKLEAALPQGMTLREIPCNHDWLIAGILGQVSEELYITLIQCTRCKEVSYEKLTISTKVESDNESEFRHTCGVCGSSIPPGDYYCPNRVSANNGGCWICRHVKRFEDDSMEFDPELDAYYHEDCLPEDCNTLLEYERKGLEE